MNLYEFVYYKAYNEIKNKCVAIIFCDFENMFEIMKTLTF